MNLQSAHSAAGQAILDSHLHIYPDYDLQLTLDYLFARFCVFAPAVGKFGYLAERWDCDYFHRLCEAPDQFNLNKYEIVFDEGKRQLSVRRNHDGAELVLAPGFQVITRENIEVLALACEQRVSDGDDAIATVRNVIANEGVPVIPWSPGKWFFQRRKVIEEISRQFRPGEILFGDTSLRPLGWPTPTLIKKMLAEGFQVVAGSDPLPFAGEEERFGSFGTRVSVPETDISARALLRGLLAGDVYKLDDFGSRSHPFDLAIRLYKNNRAKH